MRFWNRLVSKGVSQSYLQVEGLISSSVDDSCLWWMAQGLKEFKNESSIIVVSLLTHKKILSFHITS